MAKNGVSYQDLYNLIDGRTKEIMTKIDGHETRIVKIESWQSRVVWQLGLTASVGGALIVSGYDWVKKKIGL